MTSRNFTRFAAVAGLTVVFAATTSGCFNDILTVENPTQIPISQLNNDQLVPVLVASAVGEFTHMYDDPFIWRGSMLTDQQVTGINWEQTARINVRIVRYEEGDADLMFSSISRALREGEDNTARLRGLLAHPDSDASIATTLAFTGYSYVVMGEAMCEATVSTVDTAGTVTPGDHILTPDSLFLRAVPDFQEAISVANKVGNSQISNLAKVGLARAYLNLNDMADVKATLTPMVPANFQYWLEYGDSPTRLNNVLYTRVTGNNHALGMAPWFLQTGDTLTAADTAAGALPFGTQNLAAYESDPRIQHTPTWSKGHNALTELYKPYQGLRFSGYTGRRLGDGTTATGMVAGTDVKLYEASTKILLADYVEAMHDYAEADGPTAATVSFIDQRRAVGYLPASNLTPGTDDAQIMQELRNQRARDLFLGGFRLGDLRRWLRHGVGNFFPTGPHVNTALNPATWPDYQDATCFPIPLPELEANPNAAIKNFGPPTATELP
jgi:SusD family